MMTASEEIQGRARALQQLWSGVWGMRQAKDIEHLLTTIGTILTSRRISFVAYSINLVDASGGSLPVQVYIHDPAGKQFQATLKPDQAEARIIFAAWKSGKMLYRPDLTKENAYGEHLQPQPAECTVRSALDIPFSHGTLALASAQPHAFSEEDLSFLKDLVQVVEGGFQRLEDLRRLERRALEAEALAQAISAVAGTEALDDVLQIVVREAGHLMSSSRTTLFLYSEEESLLVPRAQTGHNWEIFCHYRLQPGEWLAGHVFVTGKPYLVAQLPDPILKPLSPEAEVLLERAAHRRLLKGGVAVPLEMAGRVIGVLSVAAEERAFDRRDLELLGMLGKQAVLAIERARRTEQLEQQVVERQQAEEALRQSTEHVRAMASALPDLLFVLDEEGRYLEVLTSQENLLYVEAEKIKGLLMHEVLPKEAADLFLGVVHNTLTSGKPQVVEYALEVLEGPRHFEGRTAPLPEVAGEKRRIVWVSRDITQRKQAEEQIREATAQRQYLFENLDEVFWSLDLIQQQILQISPACEALYGMPQQAFLDDPLLWKKVIHPDDVQAVDAAQPALFAGQSVTHEYRILRPDGQVRWVEVKIKPTRSEAGQVFRLDGISADITARKRTEGQQLVLQQVREQVWRMRGPEDIHQVLAAIREGLEAQQLGIHDCGISLIDAEVAPPTIRFHNITPEREWKLSDISEASEMILNIWREWKVAYRPDLEAEDLYAERERIQRYSPGIRSVVDVSFSHGTLAINSTEPKAFSQPEIVFLQQLAEVLSEGFQRLDDLKTLTSTEGQLRQAQKMEAIGQLAGGIAHDFNNLITIISGYSEVLSRRLNTDPLSHSSLQEIQKAADRGTGLVRQLLAFSRRQVLEPKVLNLNTTVRDLEKMLGRLIGEDIELATLLDPSLGPVKADPGQLEQVLMNLMVNARDAMPQGGTLILKTQNVDLDKNYTSTHVAVAPGPYVLLEVSDTGVGMDASTQARIFEPFFTTKELGKGTGLGLATVYGIIKQSGGYIWVYSEPGKGTSFKIYLPRVAAAVGPVVQEEATQTARGSETILLVEDEKPLRELVALLLREQGYTVLEAGRGEEALTLSAQQQGLIHLVMTDMVMPGMNGPALVKQLTPSRPELKILYTSGYSAEIIERQGALEPGTIFLQKPFRAEALLLKVREALSKA